MTGPFAEGLRERLHDALTREHYRRARERIEASPEDHCAALTDVALAALREYEEDAAGISRPEGRG